MHNVIELNQFRNREPDDDVVEYYVPLSDALGIMIVVSWNFIDWLISMNY